MSEYITGIRVADGSIKQIDYNYLANRPSKLSDFTNDEGFVTENQILDRAGFKMNFRIL